MQCVMMCIEFGWSIKQVEDIVLNPRVPIGTACLDQSGSREDPLRPEGQGDRVANTVDLELEARAKEIEKENKREQVEHLDKAKEEMGFINAVGQKTCMAWCKKL